jgi:hypothetical protein
MNHPVLYLQQVDQKVDSPIIFKPEHLQQMAPDKKAWLDRFCFIEALHKHRVSVDLPGAPAIVSCGSGLLPD